MAFTVSSVLNKFIEAQKKKQAAAAAPPPASPPAAQQASTGTQQASSGGKSSVGSPFVQFAIDYAKTHYPQTVGTNAGSGPIMPPPPAQPQNAPQQTPNEQVELPEAPDVGQPYNYDVPGVDAGQISDAFGNMAADVGAIQAPSVQDAYGNVQPLQNLGGQMAGYYDNLKYQEDTDNINRLYDDMMKMYNWDETKQEVLREGSAGSRMAAAANAAAGRSLGGAFMAGQNQADINTQGALMAKKMDFLGRLTEIQQNRAQALATEHQLGQKYGIEIGEKQADIKASEDKAVRDFGSQLELTKAAAQLGVDETKYTALVNATVAGDTAKANALVNELSRAANVDADRLRAQADATANMMVTQYGVSANAALQAAGQEPVYTDASTSTGTNVQVDPKTGVGKDLTTGKTISAVAMTAIQQSNLQMKMNEGVVDVRSQITQWAENNPGATKQQLLNQAGKFIYQGLINMMKKWDPKKKDSDIVNWARDHMKKAYGGDWESNFTGIIQNNVYKLPTPVTAGTT